MIDLYTAPTPNGWKISIMLEECGLPYTPHLIRLDKGEQFAPEFLAISPNNRIPAIVDNDPTGSSAPLAIFESGAILLYLADKAGRFLPTDIVARIRVTEWLMWQMGGLGPMLGQNGHFKLYAPEPVPYAQARYEAEAKRLYGVLDRQLATTEGFVAGDYSIADMAIFPWIMTHKAQGFSLADFPAIRRWYATVRAREKVQAGLAVGRESLRKGPMDDETRRNMFGARAAEAHAKNAQTADGTQR